MRLLPPSARRGRLITLVPLVDAMLILLAFFLVTSTYLDLDQVPLSETETAAPSAGTSGETLLIRIAPDGTAIVAGQRVADLETSARALLQDMPDRAVLVFPSPAASVQTLVTAMEALIRAGAGSLRVVRTETAE